MPPRPESDGPNANAAKPSKETEGNAQAMALPGCADYWNPAKSSWFMVCGRILDKYNQLGGPGGFLGLPTSNELINPDGVGKRTSFTSDSSIYWSPATDAHQIGGAIGAEWARQGWEGGGHGYPTTDELGTPGNTGRYNHFQKTSSIYWSGATGPSAFTVWGAIRQNWASRGWEAGRFGYPTSNEFPFEGGTAQNYQGGTIDWLPGDPVNPADEPEPVNGPQSVGYRSSGSGTDVSGPAGSSAPASRNAGGDLGDEPAIAELDPGASPPAGATGALNFTGKPMRTQNSPDPEGEPLYPIDCGFTKGGNPHPSKTKDSRDRSKLAYPEEIHTTVVSQCTTVGPTPVHKIKAKTGRFRWWVRPQMLKQVPFPGKAITDNERQAEKSSTSGGKLTLTSSVRCKAGTRFRYITIFAGEFAFPGEPARPYGENIQANPRGDEQTCIDTPPS